MYRNILPNVPSMWYGNPSPICFIGSVMRLLEYLGDRVEQDELIALSGVGLCFPWKPDSVCDEVSVIPEIPMRTFEALGYESAYYSESVRTNRLLPGTIDVGRWPLPAGSYDPGLDTCGIPDGIRLYGLFDAVYSKLDAPERIAGYTRVDSPEALSGKAWCVVHAPSGYDYALVSGEEDAAGGRMYTKTFYLEKIRQSIDANRPVIGFGITTKQPYACLIVGYDDRGVYTRAFWPAEDMAENAEEYFYSEDWYENCAGLLVVGEKTGERMTGRAAYGRIVEWAQMFRMTEDRTVGKQEIPICRAAFPAMGDWLRNNAWETERDILKNEVWLKPRGLQLLAYYRRNLYAYLWRLNMEHPGVVNLPALVELEQMNRLFDDIPYPENFASMRERAVRERLAGHVMKLEDCDSSLQWILFMPDFVKKQMRDFEVAQFEYREYPAMRFIGVDEATCDAGQRVEKMRVLEAMEAYKSGFDYDILFMHHHGQTADTENSWQGVWGRFMKADTPVPEGFISFDFVPYDVPCAGPPYYARFAFARFAGTAALLHERQGYDSDAMYDVTRNIILGDGVPIPYPEKYWFAEVFLNGCDKPGSGFLFSTGIRA